MSRVYTFISLIFFACWGSVSIAHAEEVKILSGEHEDFSRLVFIFPKAINWSKRKYEKGFEVTFDRGGLTMDMSKIFTKIPRNRIEDVEFEPDVNTVRVVSGCECNLEIFEVRPGVIAMDMNEKRTLSSPTKSALLGFLEKPSDPNMISEMGIFSNPRNFSMLTSQDENSYLKNFRSSLKEQLDAASEAGIVGRNSIESLSEVVDLESDRGSVDEIPLSSRTHPQAEITEAINPNRYTRLDILDRSDLDCGSYDLDNAQLGAVDDPHQALVSARAGIFNDSGEADLDSMRSLFETYISLNQPQEAESLIAEWPAIAADLSAEKALVSVLNENETDYLTERMRCGVAWMFFGLLGSDTTPRLSEADLNQLYSYFRGLSTHLQIALQGRFSEKLKVNGQDSIAASVNRQASLIAFSMGEDVGIRATASKELERAFLNQGDIHREHVPQSLIDLLEAQLSTRARIDPALIELARAVALEFRGLSESSILFALSGLAILRNGEINVAYQVFAQGEKNLNSDDSEMMRARMASELFLVDDDALFLSAVFKQRPWSWLAGSNREIQEKIRARAYKLGIADETLADLGLSRRSFLGDDNVVERHAGVVVTPPSGLPPLLKTVEAPSTQASLTEPSDENSSNGLSRTGYDQRLNTTDKQTSSISAGLQNSYDLLKASREARNRINEILSR